MPGTRMIGLVLLVGAIVVLGIAYQQSGSFADQTKHLFTGDYRDKTAWMIVIGGVAGVLGLVSLVAPLRRGEA